jgi:hypothetical protein
MNMKPIIYAEMSLVSDMDELYLPLSELLASPLYRGVPPYQVKRWYESSVIEQLTPFPQPGGGTAYSLHQCHALVSLMRLHRALELRYRCTIASTRRTTIPRLPQQEEAAQRSA